MKNTKKKILTLTMVIALFFIIVLPTIVNATTSVEIPNPQAPTGTTISDTASKIIGIVQLIAVSVAVVMLIIYGVRYFTAAPDKQADLKKAVWGYIIGAVCIFGAVAILGFVQNSLKTEQLITNE